MADKAISLEQFKEALKAIRNSTISEPDLSVRFVENAPNWNAVEGEAGYIQGRTHWSEMSVVDIFKDLEVSELEEGAGQGMLPGTYDIEAEKQYIVTYNGTEFRCTSAYFGEEGVNMAVVIGNVDALTGTGDSGEPFLLMFVLPEFIEAVGFASAIMFLDGSSFAVISLSGEAEIVHKLPQKYYDPSDWEANDYEAGHILNRPFGESGFVVMPETDVTFETYEGSLVSAIIDAPAPLEVGKRYMVAIDGKKEFVAATGAGSTSVILGDLGIVQGSPITGESFAIVYLENENLWNIFILNSYAGQKAKIEIRTSELKQLEPKFIPKSAIAPYVLNLTSAKDYQGNDVIITEGEYVTFYIDTVVPDPKDQVDLWDAAMIRGLDIIFVPPDYGSAKCIRMQVSEILFNHPDEPSFDDILMLRLIGWNGSKKISMELNVGYINNIGYASKIVIFHE